MDFHGFAEGVFRHRVDAASSVLIEVERFTRCLGEVAHGKRITEALRATHAPAGWPC